MSDPSRPPCPDDVETVEPLEQNNRRRASTCFWLTILAHPQPARVGERAALFRGEGGSPAALSRLEPLFRQPAGGEQTPLRSPFLSRKPVWIAPASAGSVLLTPATDGSEVRVSGQPVLASRRFAATDLRRGVVLELARRVVLLLHASEKFERFPERLGFIGESEAMERLRATLARAASLDVSVLLEGESGSGKELAARAIHQLSPRKRRPFVSVNLAAVPVNTAASELFGHSAGAFTGATGEHRGYFQQAEGGSLFLDEIGTATLDIQAALLRALDSGEVQPLGAGLPRKVDVRVLAATDIDLETAVSEGRFRAPLFHRLTACRVRLAPLRDRREDIGRLFYHFLARELEATGLAGKLHAEPEEKAPWLPAGLVAGLAERHWPGNVRQLSNFARQLVIDWGEVESIDTQSALARLDSLGENSESAEAPKTTGARPVEISDNDLVAAMRQNRYSIQATARQLGISRNTLYALIRRCPRLRKAKDIGGDELQRALEECGHDLEKTAERLEISLKALKLRLKDLGLV